MSSILPGLVISRSLTMISRGFLVMICSGNMMFRSPMLWGHDFTDCCLAGYQIQLSALKHFDRGPENTSRKSSRRRVVTIPVISSLDVRSGTGLPTHMRQCTEPFSLGQSALGKICFGSPAFRRCCRHRPAKQKSLPASQAHRRDAGATFCLSERLCAKAGMTVKSCGKIVTSRERQSRPQTQGTKIELPNLKRRTSSRIRTLRVTYWGAVARDRTLSLKFPRFASRRQAPLRQGWASALPPRRLHQANAARKGRCRARPDIQP